VDAAPPADPACQEYLLAACMGKGPDSPECRDARTYFTESRPPLTPADFDECRAKAAGLGAGAVVEPAD